VAVLSALAARKEVAAGRLVAREVEGLRCDREMFLVTDRRRALPAPARLFVNFLDANPVPDLTS
jgi:DNA-binding transcriptional LysR family regulator